MQFRFLCVTIALAAAGSVQARAQEGYALYTQWDDTALDQSECKKSGEQALRRAGFTDDFAITENAAYGRRKGGYTASVRCISSKKMVFYVISGPQGDLSSKYLEEIVKNY